MREYKKLLKYNVFMVKKVSREKNIPGLLQPENYTETADSCQENLVNEFSQLPAGKPRKKQKCYIRK